MTAKFAPEVGYPPAPTSGVTFVGAEPSAVPTYLTECPAGCGCNGTRRDRPAPLVIDRLPAGFTVRWPNAA